MLNLLRHRLQRLSWVALLAILALAVVPTLSRALAATNVTAESGLDPMAEVCTMDGMGGTEMPATDAPAAPPADGGHLDHCPLCGLAGPGAGLAPLPPLSWRLPEGGAELLPRLFLRAPRPLFVWAGVQSRAPPLPA